MIIDCVPHLNEMSPLCNLSPWRRSEACMHSSAMNLLTILTTGLAPVPARTAGPADEQLGGASASSASWCSFGALSSSTSSSSHKQFEHLDLCRGCCLCLLLRDLSFVGWEEQASGVVLVCLARHPSLLRFRKPGAAKRWALGNGCANRRGQCGVSAEAGDSFVVVQQARKGTVHRPAQDVQLRNREGALSCATTDWGN